MTIGDVHKELADYICFGGFPVINLKEYAQEEAYAVVRDIYNSVIFSDIVKRNQIKKIDQPERVVKYTFQNVGNVFSAKSISDFLKSEHRSPDSETIYAYSEKLEKAYILHHCLRYDLRRKNSENLMNKICCCLPRKNNPYFLNGERVLLVKTFLEYNEEKSEVNDYDSATFKS